jgi:hypothetical protein
VLLLHNNLHLGGGQLFRLCAAFTQQPAWRRTGGAYWARFVAFLQGKLVRGPSLWKQWYLGGFYY